MPEAVASNQAGSSRAAGFGLAVISITALFFIWAFVTNLIDPLVKSMKVIYTLSQRLAEPYSPIRVAVEINPLDGEH